MMDDEVLLSPPLPPVAHMSHNRQEMCAIMNEARHKTLAHYQSN